MSQAGARDQVNRLLALVPYLQSRGEISVDEAAREFGVPARTIRRDINVLLFCGLPGLGMGDLIEVDFEALEGDDIIRLSNADYLSRPLRLDSTEAAALMVALRALRDGSSPEERAVVDRALAKISTAAGEGAGVAEHVQVLPADGPDEQSTWTVRTTRPEGPRASARGPGPRPRPRSGCPTSPPVRGRSAAR